MYLIDEKGKVFGIINLFDMFFLFLFILLFLTGYRYLIQNEWPNISEPEHKETIVWVNRTITMYLSNQTKLSDVYLKAGFNYTFNNNSSIVVTEILNETENDMTSQYIKIFAKLKKNKEDLYLADELVKIRVSLMINTEKIILYGVVTNID